MPRTNTNVPSDRKVISRIKGGLGNQLFCYAAARRLALVNDAELVIDDVTGFSRDHGYRRRYLLDRFNIPARKATQHELMIPFERYRRGMMKWSSRRVPFSERRYIEQEGVDFDERLLAVRVTGVLYLDGYWQSEGYFKDVEKNIREDLRIHPPEDPINREMAEQIRECTAVCVHMRWFDAPDCGTSSYNLSTGYYRRAVAEIERRVRNPQYFLFSDYTAASERLPNIPDGRVIPVVHNHGDHNAYADLWLMVQCKHFIIANSTYSWWGAWLANHDSKIVIAPSVRLSGVTAWGFKGLLPSSWTQI